MQRHPFAVPTTAPLMRPKTSSPEMFLVLATAVAALAARFGKS
jgi:hypothetical protein